MSFAFPFGDCSEFGHFVITLVYIQALNVNKLKMLKYLRLFKQENYVYYKTNFNISTKRSAKMTVSHQSSYVLPGYRILLIIPGAINVIIPVSFKAPPNKVPALACTMSFADSVLCTISCAWKVNMHTIKK